MREMFLFAIAAPCMLAGFLQQANAGEQIGHISEVAAHATTGRLYFIMSGTPSGKPACATQSYWLVPNETTDAGKKLYALILEAHATGKQVHVYGANTCTRWTDGEDISQLVVLGD